MKIKDLYNAFCKLLEPKPDEIDAFLGPYRRLSIVQIDYILRVVNEEIKKSQKFGLKILPEHQLHEKHVIMAIFNYCGQTLNTNGSKYSGLEYSGVIHDLVNLACKTLEKEIDYYFENTPKGETSNRYNCHIDSLISHLAKDFMDEKCAPWMPKNIPTK